MAQSEITTDTASDALRAEVDAGLEYFSAEGQYVGRIDLPTALARLSPPSPERVSETGEGESVPGGYVTVPCLPSYKQIAAMADAWGYSLEEATETWCSALDVLAASSPAPHPVGGVGELIEALEWYGEQARLCRLIHSEGDAGRHALADDGGKRARAALLASPGTVGEGWQPIETAPKDGTRILAAWMDPDGRLRTDYGVAYWLSAASSWRESREDRADPTHWRPLPAAPTLSGGSK